MWLRQPRPATTKAVLQRIPVWVEAVRKHGGDVVFVRMPISGSLKRLTEQTYPDRDHWIQVLAARNITVIDFAKEPTLSMFNCPDESHLDADDAERFSAALAGILKDRKLVTGGEAGPQ